MEDEVFLTECVVIYVDDKEFAGFFACEGAYAMELAAKLAAEGKKVVVKRELQNCWPDELAAAEARCANK